MKEPCSDVLAGLAAPEMGWLWSMNSLVALERELWIAVLSFQGLWLFGHGSRDRGRELMEHVSDYAEHKEHVDLASIRRRELVTKHDIKARIEEFNALAGHESIHLGMTSADVVENCYTVRMKRGLRMLGLHRDADRLMLRGIKGAVGTCQDQIDLLGSEGTHSLDVKVAQCFDFDPEHLLTNVGQVPPRSQDLAVAAAITAAWPHPLTSGFMQMLAGISGDTWNEGDVSHSVVRRVAIPGLFHAASWLVSER